MMVNKRKNVKSPDISIYLMPLEQLPSCSNITAIDTIFKNTYVLHSKMHR